MDRGRIRGKFKVVFKEKEFQLKDGRNAFLRSPSADDAENMLQFIIKASGETDFGQVHICV